MQQKKLNIFCEKKRSKVYYIDNLDNIKVSLLQACLGDCLFTLLAQETNHS